MSTGPAERLLNLSEGWVDDRLIEDDALYDVELERIFAEDWTLVAHETHLSQSGAFVTTHVGEDPLVVVRQDDGSMRAFLNSCRHRGLQVCRPPSGVAAEFVCGNHGWTYALSGELSTIGGVPAEPLVGSGIGLVPVAHLATREGWVKVSWSDEDPGSPVWGAFAGAAPTGAPERVSLAVNWKTAAIRLRERIGAEAAAAPLGGPYESAATQSVHTLQPRGSGQTVLTTWRLAHSDALDVMLADLTASDLRLPVRAAVVETRVSVRRAQLVEATHEAHDGHDHADGHSCAPPLGARPVIQRALGPVGVAVYSAWAARLDDVTRQRVGVFADAAHQRARLGHIL